MDRGQEEIHFIGLLGIFIESLSIITSWRKVFTRIVVIIILPLSIIFLAHVQISELLFSEILRNQDVLDQTRVDTEKYVDLLDMISSEWFVFWVFKILYFVFFLLLSLLSTSAVVYTIACLYTSKEMPSFYELMTSVVPRVWKRLVVTFLWNFVIVFMYNVVAIIVFILSGFFVSLKAVGFVILFFIALLYLTGFVYINIIWHLASVVSVLEDVYGIQAMIKSKGLIKGKLRVAGIIFLTLNLFFVGIQITYQQYVVAEDSLWCKMLLGMLYLSLLVILILLGLVIQTVFYFICKSYHHETINKLSLMDHLEAYLGHYVPLDSNDVQLEKLHV
ncbi:uncharacterized protein LOC124930204 [Impatiens glandulifera]|uniref:uncharacterized protein LOC124930204 n=1 Tax=Impatiens glandulifera TaxID=253017 RepID=UPI001FB0919F|nr:uncharacterized protein LOC124930204 [Impatiens glandulifera]